MSGRHVDSVKAMDARKIGGREYLAPAALKRSTKSRQGLNSSNCLRKESESKKER